MRKLWCAGAIACGVLLGAAPAHAEPLPGPGVAEAPMNALGYALEPTNDWRLSSPLASDPLSGQPLVDLEPGGGRKLLQVDPGDDTGLPRTLPAREGQRKIGKPADRRPLLPAADVVSGTRPDPAKGPSGALGGVPVSGVPMPLAGQDFSVADTPVDSFVGTLPLLSSLNPSGSSAIGSSAAGGTRRPAADERPFAAGRMEATAARADDAPLLGGLAGTASTVNDLQRRVVDVQSDLSGLPLGGEPVRRSARLAPPPTTAPSTSTPAGPASAATPPPGTALAGTAPAATAPAATTPAATKPAATKPAGSVAPAGRPAPTVSAAPVPAASNQRNQGFPATEAEDPRLYEEPVDGFVGK
ncbi:hypothetical protein [Actinoplanes sp. GCM10030250]|uniref:hypothetical protein n=1 Tax=Actinoplanes sp. GCM10030250 TaxID=3273376 RepID=UPI00361DA576